MENIKLVLAYDGKSYLGWQKTSMGASIEEALQKILEQILQHPVILQAASRTDAGVHANGQVVNFTTPHLPYEPQRLQISLNSLLPKDIVVLKVEQMEPTFHPTLDCKGKEYCYCICHDSVQMPHHRFYSWHYHHPLDFTLMKSAAEMLEGTHDFTSFCNVKKNSRYDHFERTIEAVEIVQLEQNRFMFKIRGNHFLYKMVRNIVGTLVYVGAGKIKLNDISAILEGKNRVLAGVTAPAHGLFLNEVFFGETGEGTFKTKGP